MGFDKEKKLEIDDEFKSLDELINLPINIISYRGIINSEIKSIDNNKIVFSFSNKRVVSGNPLIKANNSKVIGMFSEAYNMGILLKKNRRIYQIIYQKKGN